MQLLRSGRLISLLLAMTSFSFADGQEDMSLLLPSDRSAVVIGRTYPIAEPDTLEEIKKRAASVDWKKWMRKDPKKYSAFSGVSLPRVKESDTRLFDPTYELPRAIVDRNGKVLYPKGFKVNVYEKITLPGRYIIVGPTEADRDWVREVAKPTENDRIFVAGGNVLDWRRLWNLPVYALDERGIERLGIRATPSVVEQEGMMLRVTEYGNEE